MPSRSIDSEQAWISTPPRSLAWRSVSYQGAWPAARSALDRGPALGPRLGCEAVVGVDAVRAEGVERPVLQEDVDRAAERGGPGGQDRGGVELVVGAAEEHQGEGLVVHGSLPRLGASWPWSVRAVGRPSMAAESSAMRARRRRMTCAIRSQAPMTPGSVRR